MTITDDELTAALRRCFADHEGLADPAALQRISAAPPKAERRRRATVPALAAAVVAAVSVGIGALAAHHGPSSAPSASVTRTGDEARSAEADRRWRILSEGDPEGAARNRAATAAYLEQVIESVGIPAGFTRVPEPPVESLRHSGASFSGNEMEVSRFYVTEGTVPSALEAVRTPTGYSLESWSEDSSGSVLGRIFSASPQSETEQHKVAHLTLSSAPIGAGRVGLRVGAQSGWFPARTAEQTIDPATVVAARVTRTRQTAGAPDVLVHDTALTGSRLRPIVELLNTQLTVIQSPHSCMPVFTQEIDRLELDTTAGPVTIEFGEQCRPGIALSRNGSPLGPWLTGTHELRSMVDTAIAGLASPTR